tara:strand:- start:6336 stop:7133 length:798 start_codon:yes stop_codon:yes gene_type:complete
MKLKDFLKTVSFKDIEKKLFEHYYKTEKFALDFFENNPEYLTKADDKYNYKVFKNNIPDDFEDLKGLTFKGFKELLDEYKKDKFNGLSQAYKKVYLKVINKSDKETDGMLIYVDYVKDRLNTEGYHDVSGTYNKTFQEMYESGEDELFNNNPPTDVMKDVLYTYAIEFEPWIDWANMEIHEKSFKNVPDNSDLAAHILWEMTFCGFTEQHVENQKKQLMDVVDDFEKMKKEGRLDELETYTMEEVEEKILDLKDKIKNKKEEDDN